MTINFAHFNSNPQRLFNLLMLVIIGLVLSGCESSNQSKTTAPELVKKYAKLTTLKGAVNYKDHTIMPSGLIKATDHKGQVVATAAVAQSNHYRIDIPEGTELPIVLTFYPEIAGDGKGILVCAVVHPNITQYDLNPLTTAIAKKAQELGGYTHTNMIVAAETTVHVPDENKTSGGWRGDPTKQYGGWH